MQMSIKQQVLQALEEHRGESLSGSELAEQFGVSRNAVWKAVQILKEEGHFIGAVTNRGYMLSEQSDILSAQSICKYLTSTPLSDKIHVKVFSTVTSTNTVARQLAEAGEPEGTVVLANEQTMGKGRLGRNFYSPGNTGLYMSFLLRPQIPAEDALLITTAAAVAASEAIEAVMDADIQIKWVNDLYLGGKKVCGILTEASFDMESGGLSYAILGIGINVASPDEGFPEDLTSRATSLLGKSVHKADLRSRLAAQVIQHFFSYYPVLAKKTFMSEYRRRSFLIGKEVDAVKGGVTERVKVLDVDEDARLVVVTADGVEKFLSSGEVTLHKA